MGPPGNSERMEAGKQNKANHWEFKSCQCQLKKKKKKTFKIKETKRKKLTFGGSIASFIVPYSLNGELMAFGRSGGK